MSDTKTETKKATPTEQKDESAAKADSVESKMRALLAAPTATLDMDNHMKELLRLVNGGERQIVGALEQMQAAACGSGTGADALYETIARDITEMAAGVRNAAMNHALLVKAAASGKAA